MPANRKNPGVHHTARQSRDRQGALVDYAQACVPSKGEKYSPEAELAGETACPTFACRRLAVGGAGGFACELHFFSPSHGRGSHWVFTAVHVYVTHPPRQLPLASQLRYSRISITL
jgi:hypothetical protein